MVPPELCFVVPTYRLRDVGETVQLYDEEFWRNGHTPTLMVFDDSSLGNYRKYYKALEATATHQPIHYVGPLEKERFLAHLNSRLRDKRLQSLIRYLFRPSYGGNRNFTVLYTLGGLMVSSDDDMRPWALVENGRESLSEGQVSRGRLIKTGEDGYTKKAYDILGAFTDVLGKKVSELPANYERGELLVDSAMDLETNATKGLARDNSLVLVEGRVDDGALTKIAQTFRCGTNDIDALDFVQMFLEDEEESDLDRLTELYVLVNFRPVVTNKNWRMDCGVAGYDNTFGLPPFFPTWLRFEDYIYRLWIQQEGVVAAHVDAAQTHVKNSYMRNTPAAEVFNEEVANLLKRKIKATLTKLDELGIAFDYDGEVTAEDADEILAKISATHRRILELVPKARSPERADALRVLANGLAKAFYGFEPDFFQQNLERIASDVIAQIKASIEAWPTLVEICYFEKSRHGLPQTVVANRRKE